MRKPKLVEAVLYQCLLTTSENIPITDKVHILSLNYLSQIELQDIPRVIHSAYVEMQTLLDNLLQLSRSASVNNKEEQARIKMYREFVKKLIDLYSEVVRWNNLESYIESSQIRMKCVSTIQ